MMKVNELLLLFAALYFTELSKRLVWVNIEKKLVTPYVALKRLLRINLMLSDRNKDKSSFGESGPAVC